MNVAADKRCLVCAHGALRDAADPERDEILRKMAGHGMVNCTKSVGRATFLGFNRWCMEFEPSDGATISARLAWQKAIVSRGT